MLANDGVDGALPIRLLSDQHPKQRLTGVAVKRVHVDKGYRGHNANRFKVWITGQVRRTTAGSSAR